MNSIEEQQLIEKVRDILAEEFEVDRDLMTEDAPLMSTLDLDSLDIVDLAVVVERRTILCSYSRINR